MNMKKTLVLVLILGAGALVVLGYGRLNTGNDQIAESGLTEVNIGFSRLRISLPVFVAEEQGFFEAHGINATLEMYETAQPLMQALVQGQIDVAGYTALPITYNGMLRSEKKLYFSSVMVEDQQHRISYLLRPTGSTAINSVADLKGKTVGILPTIAYKAWLEAMLKKEGVDLNSVRIQQIAPTLQAQTLKSKGVDALFTNDPAATSAIQTGTAELVSSAVEVPQYLGEPFPFGSFNLSKTWVDANPETANNIVLALDDAIKFINENPDKAKQAMTKYLPEIFQPHVELYPNALYLDSAETSEKVLNDAASQYLEIGIIQKPLSLDGLVLRASRK